MKISIVRTLEDNMNRRKEILKFMDTQAYRPLTQEELIEHFLIDDIEEIKDFNKTLNEMEEKGKALGVSLNSTYN